MGKKIPSTEDYVIEAITPIDFNEEKEIFYIEPIPFDKVVELMREFAKLHVEACKREIIENVLDNTDDSGWYIKPTEKDILNSYPLENIK